MVKTEDKTLKIDGRVIGGKTLEKASCSPLRFGVCLKWYGVYNNTFLYYGTIRLRNMGIKLKTTNENSRSTSWNLSDSIKIVINAFISHKFSAMLDKETIE